MGLHVHLDPVGGLAGDMFLASILHAWADLEETILTAMRAAGLPANWTVKVEPGASAGIVGIRLAIQGDGHDYGPTTGSFKEVRARLEISGLSPGVRDRAVDIFHRLALAEADVHGRTVDDVHFHEIADWDSVADITGAAAAIEELGTSSWSVGQLPMGAGTIKTAHGLMPVPAPATALLLRNYRLTDDGVSGERITPTGAAILAHLEATQDVLRPSGRLLCAGHGLGTKEIPGLANVVRLLAFETSPDCGWVRSERVGVVTFEIDDQTPEELALGLDGLRAAEGVLDVLQTAVTAKKGRLAVSVRVLCCPHRMDGVIEACFLQTTTIGLRYRVEDRMKLDRTFAEREGVGAKTVVRPDGVVTVKVELNDLSARTATQADRARLRRMLEEDEKDG
ncbi:MAG: hypothetical protein CMM47_03285 [Rhodospirillaceae bacterium]|nr:hypothetical protein [Rhodospirillaceae bacterium]